MWSVAKWLRSYHRLIYICCGDNVSTNSTKKQLHKQVKLLFSKLGTVPLNSKLPPSHGKWIAACTVTETCYSQFSLLQKQKYNGTVRSWISPESHIFLRKIIWKDVHKCDTAAWCNCHNSLYNLSKNKTHQTNPPLILLVPSGWEVSYIKWTCATYKTPTARHVRPGSDTKLFMSQT